MKRTRDGRYHNMDLQGYRKGFGVELKPGQKFRYEVKLRDEKGYHIGYGPGADLHTMQEGFKDERGSLVMGPQRVYIQE